MSVQINIAPLAEHDFRVAIDWRSRVTSATEAKSHIKTVLSDFRNQITLYPESGRPSRFLPDSDFREAVKDDYLFLYEISTSDTITAITILAFSHQRMDFKTLLHQRNLQSQLL